MSATGGASRRRRFRPLIIAAAVLLGIAALGTAGFIIWAVTGAAEPSSEALAVLAAGRSGSGAGYTVSEQGDWLIFRPAASETGEQEQPTLSAGITGFIFYPGGLVPPEAYAPALSRIAGAGFFVAVPSMPLNLAVLAPGKAREMIGAFPGIGTWAIGGHSLGAAMAANFIHGNPGAAAGLVLWAGYPAGSDNLSEWSGGVISIYGTRDGLATPEKVEASASLLPPDAHFAAISGGNHAQFGSYGPQDGDNPPRISAAEQESIVTTQTINFLTKL